MACTINASCPVQVFETREKSAYWTQHLAKHRACSVQEDLVQQLRRDGRQQAQHRNSKQKREVHFQLNGTHQDDGLDESN
jgi:hypothetical protein